MNEKKGKANVWIFILLGLILLFGIINFLINQGIQNTISDSINPSYIYSSQSSDLKWRDSLVQEQTNRWDIYFAQGYGGDMTQETSLSLASMIKIQSNEFIKRDIDYLNSYKNYISCLQGALQSGLIYQKDYDDFLKTYKDNIKIAYQDMNSIKDSYDGVANNYNYNWDGDLRNITIPTPKSYFEEILN